MVVMKLKLSQKYYDLELKWEKMLLLLKKIAKLFSKKYVLIFNI